MNHSQTVGISFGLTSGVITTLGLIVGLHSGTHSKLAVLGGIIVIAIADAFSDALGIHISEESENKHSARSIWGSTLYTFLAKFASAGTFIVPVLLLPLDAAIQVSVLYGIILLAVLSYYLAKKQRVEPWRVIAEHLLIALLVIILTHYVGDWVNSAFG